jgi:hypothetical protein
LAIGNLGRNQAQGMPPRPSRTCWLRFVEFGGEYRAFLQSLAETLLVPANDNLLLPLAA